MAVVVVAWVLLSISLRIVQKKLCSRSGFLPRSRGRSQVNSDSGHNSLSTVHIGVTTPWYVYSKVMLQLKCNL